VHWIVQENIRDESGYQAFIDALQQLNVDHTVVKVIPFAHECIPDVNPSGPVIVWGSTSMDMVAKQKGWTPGTFLNDNFDQRIWSKMYGADMLNADATFHEFCNIPAFTGERFIRPVHDLKTFAGIIQAGPELAHWQTQILALKDTYSTLRPDTPVSVSSVKEIDLESRFFVVNCEVVAGSMYRLYGQTRHERCSSWDGDWKFAQSMANHWQPADAFVIDVALSDSQFKVIEVNCINSAGFYAANMLRVIKAIERI